MSLRILIAQEVTGDAVRVNIEGRKRRGFSREGLVAIRNAYHKLLLAAVVKRSTKAKLEILPELAEKHPEVSVYRVL